MNSHNDNFAVRRCSGAGSHSRPTSLLIISVASVIDTYTRYTRLNAIQCIIKIKYGIKVVRPKVDRIKIKPPPSRLWGKLDPYWGNGLERLTGAIAQTSVSRKSIGGHPPHGAQLDKLPDTYLTESTKVLLASNISPSHAHEVLKNHSPCSPQDCHPRLAYPSRPNIVVAARTSPDLA